MPEKLKSIFEDRMKIYNNVIYSELIELVNNIQKLQDIDLKVTFEGIKVRFNTIISINNKRVSKSALNRKDMKEKTNSNSIKNRLEFNRPNLWYWNSGNNLNYFIPDIDKCIIKFEQAHLSKVEEIVYLDELVPQNYSKIEKWWISPDSNTFASSFISVHERMKKMNSNDGSTLNRVNSVIKENRMSLTEAHAFTIESQYKKEWRKSQTEIQSQDQSINQRKSIEGFEWKKVEDIIECISQHFSKEKLFSVAKNKAFVYWEKASLEDKINWLAERLYGSWCPLLDEIPKNEKERDWISNQIKSRIVTILYLTKKPIISTSKCSEFWNKLLEFIVNEMDKPSVNPYGQHLLVGNQERNIPKR